ALTGRGPPGQSSARGGRFAFKAQHFPGPMMSKSLEDAAFYRSQRLLALNEVGGDPAAGGLSPRASHARMQARAATSPYGLTATATHDTKRGEDARTRLPSLAQLTDDWRRAAPQWHAAHGRLAPPGE